MWLEINLVTRACGCSISYFPRHQKQPQRLPLVCFHRPSFLLSFYVSFFLNFLVMSREKRAVPPIISTGRCSSFLMVPIVYLFRMFTVYLAVAVPTSILLLSSIQLLLRLSFTNSLIWPIRWLRQSLIYLAPQ